jgi:endonuclease-8
VGARIVQATSRVMAVPEHRLVSATITSIDTHGKNLLVALSTGLVLHVHLKMHGRVYLYPRGAPWRQGSSRLCVAITTEAHELVISAAPVVRLVRPGREGVDARIASLGPDPLREDYERAEVLRRLARLGGTPLGVALLDQRVVAGVGNALKSEILFLAGADPFAPVERYDDAAREAIVDLVERVLRLTVERRAPTPGLEAAPRFRTPRRTTRTSLLAAHGFTDRLWVYSRRDQPCYVCGAPIAYAKQGAMQRSTYHCPSCQPARVEADAPLLPPRVGELGRSVSAVAPAKRAAAKAPFRSRCR